MKKGIILGIGNIEKYSYFIFNKEKSILLKLVELISILSKNQGLDARDYFIEYEEYNYKNHKLMWVKRNLSDLTDTKRHFSGKDFDVDVIFGKNKIFLIMYASKDITKKIRKFVSDNFEFKLTKKQLKKQKKAAKKIK